jgi:hypothetical protein
LEKLVPVVDLQGTGGEYPGRMQLNCPLVLVLFVLLGCSPSLFGEWIWVEGEAPAVNRMNRHPWWYDQVKKDQFSSGDFISNFDKDKAGEADYTFRAQAPGEYEFWVRANPLMAKLSYTLNGGTPQNIDLNREKRGEVNVAADGKPDLRFLAWSKVGKVALMAGENRIRFRMDSENNHHGYLDCFVLTTEPFQPRGLLKPNQLAEESRQAAKEQQDWLAFDPAPDPFKPSAIDLRFLNEKLAGDDGFIQVRDGNFIHEKSGKPLRFWAVNGPPHDLSGKALRDCARVLAKHGVNMVRIHGGYFDERGEVDLAKVKHAQEIVEAMKAEGIYSYFSIYFPLWLRPQPDTPWLKGYDGKHNPFAALEFNADFQAQYRKWWSALLTTPASATGGTLAAEPAVAGLEIQNEDSFFFWTFSEQNLPDIQLRILEKQFGDWLVKKHGSLEAAFTRWNQLKVKRDEPAEGRVGFRPLWAMFNEKTARDQDTARFLYELQRRFYTETYTYLRTLGFKGVISASNWSTASPEVLGPLEKMTYTATDVVDRHGYFGCNHKGDNAEWSLRAGHTYSERSALRFDAETPGKPRLFVHPAMDPHYDDKPSIITETTWNRPNRYRSEAPLYLAVYGALQHSDGIVHFALDGGGWSVKPGFWMQPWTLMSPAMMGQFPAAALIYRLGLVRSGEVVASVNLNREDLLNLKGTPLPQDAALDELRLKDVPTGDSVKPGQRLDPLLHYVGRTQVHFTDEASKVTQVNTATFISHQKQTVTSSTGELELDYGRGVLRIKTPAAQGISGNLRGVGPVQTGDAVFSSDMDLGHLIAVALDGKPLRISTRILLQVMSEERTSGFSTEPAGAGVSKVVSIGTDPWMIRKLKGKVSFTRQDAASLRVTALDANGYEVQEVGTASEINLRPETVYYLIRK